MRLIQVCNTKNKNNNNKNKRRERIIKKIKINKRREQIKKETIKALMTMVLKTGLGRESEMRVVLVLVVRPGLDWWLNR